VSRLTFNIDEEAAIVGVKRESPLLALRQKLFGIDTGRVPVRAVPVNFAQNRQAPVRRAMEMRAAPAPHLPHSFAKPAKNIARSAPASFIQTPAAPREPFQIEYKGRLIVAYLSDDGSWTATHLPLDADPSASRDFTAQDRHRFLARILAITSVQMEIDELAQQGQV